VFREAFLSTRGAARLVFLRAGYARLHDRLAAYLEARGGVVRRRALVEAVEVDGGRARGVRYLQRAETRAEIRRGRREVASWAPADAVVAAVPWSVLPSLVPEELRAQPPFASAASLRGSPIVSIEAWLDRVVL